MGPSHRAKRQYDGGQSTITNYFSPATNTPQVDPIPTFPIQPIQVQRDLLNVGMRVRKSVVEGYKTNKDQYNELSIFHDANSPTPSEADIPNQITNITATRQVFGSNIRELAPFCGLNKIGGFSQQFTSPIENFPSMTSSQESNISLESVGAGKRRFEDDDEKDEDDGDTASFLQGDFGRWQFEEQISPKSKPMGLAMRTMAVPKTRRKKPLDEWEQENMTETIKDFEEADFLDYKLLKGGDIDMNDA